MLVSMTNARAHLNELVRRAEAGEEVILTRDGLPVVRLVPMKSVADKKALRARLDAISEAAAGKATPGPSAARSQDFLYDDDGLPA